MLLAGVALSARQGVSAPPREPFTPASDRADSRIAPWLLGRLERGGKQEVLVLLDGQPDLRPTGGMERPERARFVYESLRASARTSQAPLISWLEAEGERVTSYWIVNAILVRVDLPLARAIVLRPEVRRIV